MARHWQVLTVVSAGVFMASLDVTIVNIAFPEIQRDFPDASLAGLSWILNAYAIVFAALLVPAGRFADEIGRKRGFLAGLAIFVLASATAALAPSPELLVVSRVVQAVGAALLVPTSLALLLPEFPPARRATAVGIWGATGGVAAAIGPSLGGLLVEADWRWVFLINVPVGLWVGLRARRILTEHREPGTERPDLVGAGLLALGVAALALGIVKGPDWGWDGTEVLATLAVAVSLLAGFAWRTASHPVPIVEPSLLRVRSFAWANVAGLLFSMAFFAMLFGSIIFLTQAWGYSALAAGALFSPGPLAAAAVAVASGPLGQRFGAQYVAAAGGVAVAAGVIWFIEVVGPDRAYLSELLPGIVLTGIGVGLSIATLAAAATASLPASRLATGSAVYNMSRQIGAALGIAIYVAILGTPAREDALAAFQDGWVFMALAALASSAAALAIGRVQTAELTPEGATAAQPA